MTMYIIKDRSEVSGGDLFQVKEDASLMVWGADREQYVREGCVLVLEKFLFASMFTNGSDSHVLVLVPDGQVCFTFPRLLAQSCLKIA